MKIEFKCTGCSAVLRVSSDNVGKSAQCPSCQAISIIPNTTGAPQQDPLSPLNPFANAPNSTTSGKNFTAQGAASSNPYSSPAYAAPNQRTQQGFVRPTRIRAGQAINHAFELWQNNLGLMVGCGAVIFGISMLLSIPEAMATEFGMVAPQNVDVTVNLINIVDRLISTYLSIGMVRICLALARGQNAEFGMLFNGMDKFGPVIGMGILYGLAVVAAALLLIIPGILLALVLWPYFYFIVDNQCPAMESFSRSMEIGKFNMGSSFLLALAALGIYILGFLAICIGLIFAGPLVSMIFAVAYLMMKGEISPV